jgi:DNA-binding IclR family transcriptional regulator
LTKPADRLSRGLALLETLAGKATAANGGLGVMQLAEMTGQDKSSVSRTLATLADEGYVVRDHATRRYQPGWRLSALGARGMGDHQLIEAASPVLPSLVNAVEETAHVSVLRGTQVLTLLSEQAPHAVATVGWVGRVIPAYCTSSGRALLLDHSLDGLMGRFAGVELVSRGPNTVTSLEALFDRIQLARVAGVAVVEEESEPGLVGIGAPLRDRAGQIVAALNISGPQFRLGRTTEAAAEVRAAAEQICVALNRLPGGVSTSGELVRTIGEIS